MEPFLIHDWSYLGQQVLENQPLPMYSLVNPQIATIAPFLSALEQILVQKTPNMPLETGFWMAPLLLL